MSSTQRYKNFQFYLHRFGECRGILLKTFCSFLEAISANFHSQLERANARTSAAILCVLPEESLCGLWCAHNKPTPDTDVALTIVSGMIELLVINRFFLIANIVDVANLQFRSLTETGTILSLLLRYEYIEG